jgi:hypothetical protein
MNGSYTLGQRGDAAIPHFDSGRMVLFVVRNVTGIVMSHEQDFLEITHRQYFSTSFVLLSVLRRPPLSSHRKSGTGTPPQRDELV